MHFLAFIANHMVMVMVRVIKFKASKVLVKLNGSDNILFTKLFEGAKNRGQVAELIGEAFKDLVSGKGAMFSDEHFKNGLTRFCKAHALTLDQLFQLIGIARFFMGSVHDSTLPKNDPPCLELMSKLQVICKNLTSLDSIDKKTKTKL